MRFQEQFAKVANQDHTFIRSELAQKKFFLIFNFLGVLTGVVFLISWMQNTGEEMARGAWVLCLAFAMSLGNGLYFLMSWSRHNKCLTQSGHVDSMTGAWSGAYFNSILQEELLRAGRYHHPLTLSIMDLVDLDSARTHLGQGKADVLLEEFSTFIKQQIRATDIFIRDKKDDFYLLFPYTNIVHAEKVMARLLESCQKVVGIGFCAGLSSFSPGEKRETFLERTESALEQARRSGTHAIQCLVGQGSEQTFVQF